MKNEYKLLGMEDISRMTGWHIKRVRRNLIRSGLVDKVGRRWITTVARIRAVYPELAIAILANMSK